MPSTAFNNPVLQANGDLEVTGPVVPANSNAAMESLGGEITVRFLIVQEYGGALRIADGVAQWNPGDPPDWTATVPGNGIERGDVTAIGAAILRWDSMDKPLQHPAIETYHWRVDSTVV